ncbi:MAG: anti-sigma F factor [Clostridia bacterium]|nr:anti-sigma F factor [Clostridia bacterium]MDE6210604.1 anti-sigma F factor [Clostridia bacterium]MDE6474371.1 anti-sigma F factor [Clostridia bacterium]MDE6605724.1 anti-sigma F factor [Clostridia bacterium]MDE7192290.1 anti-sigma F factor [Clostridia bacterium]
MNEFKLKLLSKTGNESFARSCVSAFCLELNPTLEEINDVKTAVSEAVTNCIVHAYNSQEGKYIDLSVRIENGKVEIIIEDEGCGIEDVEKAIQPFYTTKPDQERSGMGFTLIKTFMDKVDIISQKDKGTKVIMQKEFKKE